jgi:hypothetical protein
MQDIGENEVMEILERGHTGPREAIAGTIARVKGHGPFKRLTVSGARIGQLKFQPGHHDPQCSLSSFFEDNAARFTEWLDSLDGTARARQQFQIDQFARSNGRVDLPPVYDFEGQLLDGGHRTRAAYYAFLRSGKDLDAELEIVCDVAALP